MMRAAVLLMVWFVSGACAGIGPGTPQGAAPETAPETVPAAPAAASGVLAAQAQELAAIPGARVETGPDVLLVSFPAAALFGSGEYELEPQARDRLRSLAGSLKAHPGSQLIIKGHTDSSGDERFNQMLSEQRADSVRKFLIAEGVAHDRMNAIGFGAQMPVATNNTAEGRQENRRIEIDIRERVLSEVAR